MADELVEGGPQPEAPTKPAVATDALEEYFQSITEPFRETSKGLEKENESLSTVLIAFFISSLLPVLPFLVSRIVWRLFGSTFISVRRVHFHVGSFWFWWVVLFAVSLAALLIAVKISGVGTEEKRKWLSPPQMRFAYCYAAVDEIGKYKTNQLARHIDAALLCLDKIAAALLPTFIVPIDRYPDPFWRMEIRDSQHQAVGIENVLPGPPKWYRLRPETELILKAFSELESKFRDRLKDRKDLPAVEKAFTYLAAYQYLEIPELSDSQPEARFEAGMQSLLNFASQAIALPPYRSEELKPTPKQKISLKFFAALSKVTAPFSHDNPVVAFLCWWSFLLLLFVGGFSGALRLFAIKVDSAVITSIIAGPILGAITAVTIPRFGKRNTGS